jgi:hypothetical protein
MSANRQVVYRHRQVGRWMLLGIVLVALAGMLRFWQAPPGHWSPLQSVWIPIAVTMPIALVFCALEVRIDDRTLHWRFGWLGWPRWTLDLDDIARIEAVRTTWFEGWGLRKTRQGMLYNTEGFDALRIVRRDGSALRIGSDDVPRLAARLQAQLDRRRAALRR